MQNVNDDKQATAVESLFGDSPEDERRLAAAVKSLARRDANLAPFIKRVGKCELQMRALHNPFNSLARAIIYQQLSGRAAETIHTRLLAALTASSKRQSLTPKIVLDAPDELIRGAGVSGAKMAALRDLAARTLDGTVPTLARLNRMSDAEIIERLTQVRGIGQWTVEMLLMFHMGRTDVLPATDLAIRKGVALIDDLEAMPTPKEVLARGEVWRPFRSIASWYLYRALDIPV
jgi:DNA-3-methyladenine glycosylase II